MRAPFLFSLLFLSATAFAEEPPIDYAPVKKWIARQSDFKGVSADFVQSRALRALKSPLKSEGKLWFKAPNFFRWELGQPAKTVVVSKDDYIYVINVAKKKAERTPVGTVSKNAGAAGFGMMSFPFAKNFADFQKQFETLGLSTEDTTCKLSVMPRDARAKKMLSAIKLDFSTESGHLLAFEIVTKDGSSLRNEFSNVVLNPKIAPGTFDFDLTGYEVVDAKE